MEETGAALARLFLNTSFLHLPIAAARRRLSLECVAII